ncbi:MAG: radical SAM protein [Candidatus Omnitrophica bacterium]|nr:radical SAM protein [Candidatus Omnitrophota bacterium]
MREAMLYDQLDNGTVQCKACIRECAIAQGDHGFCKTRTNVNGKLFAPYYGYFSGINTGPLDAKPFIHFKDPDTGDHYKGDEIALSIGGFGCNFICKGCQNVSVSQANGTVDTTQKIYTPQDIISRAKKEGVRVIAFTWNEPAIMPEIVYDIAKLAHENGFKVAYVCNGTPTKEHLDLILPYVDAFRYDIKAGPHVGDPFYEDYCDLKIGSSVDKILETIKYTQEKGKHIELLTVLIPGQEPSAKRSILNTAKWIKENLKEGTPWHLAKFFPANKMKSPEFKTPDELIDLCVDLAVSNYGLKNVYAVKDKGCDCLKQGLAPASSCSCCH